MAKDIEQKGRQVPSKTEKQIKKKVFQGIERKTPWAFKNLDTGQFVTFKYNGILRKVLILSPLWYTSKGNKILTGIELNDFAWEPPKLGKLFDVKVLPRIVRTEHLDPDGFRFFAVNFDLTIRGGQPKKLYKLLQARHPLIHQNYKTYLRKKMTTGVIKMFNPVFSPATIRKFNILEEK